MPDPTQIDPTNTDPAHVDPAHVDPAHVDPVKALRLKRSRNSRLLHWVTYASAGVASLLILAKLVAWILTDSVAMLTSLIDSSLDLLASLITLYAVRQALVPADSDHRFGHGKAEPLAAMAQAGFIAGSAILLTMEAVERLIDPKPIDQTEVGLAVMGASILVTVALVMFQRYVVSQTQSVAIEADSAHYKADLLSNTAVIVALVFSGFLEVSWVDPILGLAIAAFIAYSAWGIGKDSLNMLMDRELPEEDRDRIKEIALSYPDVLGIHDLRTRRSGPDRFIQMHLDLNGQLTLNRAHATADAVEKEVMIAFPDAEVLVHQDPVTPNPEEEKRNEE